MQSVGVKILKNCLSEYVRAVAAGETVLVSDCGTTRLPRRKPVAKVDEVLRDLDDSRTEH